MKLWQFLTTDIRELNLKQAEEVTKAGTDTAKAVLDLAKSFKEQGAKVEALQSYVGEFSSLLDVLNSPIAQIVKDTVPFAPLAVSILKLIAEATKREPTLEECMMLVSQTAYLESLRSLLQPYVNQLEQKEQAKASATVTHELKALGDKDFTQQDARDALLSFPNSRMAQEFNAVLKARLQDSRFSELQADKLSDRIAWNTPRFINAALANNADILKSLAELHRNGGREVLERYQSIDTYLSEYIEPRPREKVFAESFTFQDIYVPLKAQCIKSNGEPDRGKASVDLGQWATALLNDAQQKDKVLFIQGGPGRGKSVFCRMFADWVRRVECPRWVPILIRLRDIRILEKDFEETLKKAVDRDFAKNDAGWLTDRNIRFLFLLDGFDELLMEGRTSGGLEDFLKQVGRFQESCKENSEKGHRILITGRALSLQSIERQMPSNLERVEILPMDGKLQDQWFGKWKKLVGVQKTRDFWRFLQDPLCPERIRGSKTEAGLAQEPLLLYLLAAMHRDGELTPELFADAEGARAKILIYERSLTWVLTKQRSEVLNRDLTELETESLRRILAEAGLCVAQTGGECAPISMIEKRLEDDESAKNLLDTARIRLKDNPLRNALAAFYLQPGRGGEGSVEFAHKSFGEFLCAERLQEALEDWTDLGRKGQGFYISTKKLHWEIYDLLGQPVLTQEIVEYLRVLLFDSSAFQPVALFRRLYEFYNKWCEGEFIDAPPSENLPQKKMAQFQALSISMGLRQIDVHTGLNVLILLLELHRYAQTRKTLEEALPLYFSEKPSIEADEYSESTRLLKVIHYSDSIDEVTFARIVGRFLARANLAGTNLAGTNLGGANLTSANLTSANLAGTNLGGANLTGANLTGANLTGANLGGANLGGANFDSTNLDRANLEGANFIRANLIKANLIRANLIRANLVKTNLVGANLASATFVKTDLASANLARANLFSTDLNSANLANANLARANLANANLECANLECANLECANLINANLSGVDLTNANLANANLENIIWNYTTIWKRARGLETIENLPEQLKEQLQHR